MTEQDKIIEMARQAGMYQDLNVSWNQSIQNFAKLVSKAKVEEIATACERLPFGDTAHSFAIWIREQWTGKTVLRMPTQ